MSLADWFWRWIAEKVQAAQAAGGAAAQATVRSPGYLFPPNRIRRPVTIPVDLRLPPVEIVRLDPPQPEPTRADVQQLVDQALTAPTVESLEQFVDFAGRFRKLPAYNLYMVYIQRPGAAAVATREEWLSEGQAVLPDAVPIVILRKFGPIELVYELSDTSPPQQRDPRSHVFGAEGPFDEQRLHRLIRNLKPRGKALRIDVVLGNYGTHLAGTAAAARPLLAGVQDLLSGTLATGQVAHGNFETTPHPAQDLLYRIKLNRRLTPAEQFTTLAHELGHIFCGHLGAFSPTGRAGDENGWPDRRSLKHSAQEIEAYTRVELRNYKVCLIST